MRHRLVYCSMLGFVLASVVGCGEETPAPPPTNPTTTPPVSTAGQPKVSENGVQPISGPVRAPANIKD